MTAFARSPLVANARSWGIFAWSGAVRIGGPGLRRIQLPVHQRATPGGGIGGEHADLAVLRAARRVRANHTEESPGVGGLFPAPHPLRRHLMKPDVSGKRRGPACRPGREGPRSRNDSCSRTPTFSSSPRPSQLPTPPHPSSANLDPHLASLRPSRTQPSALKVTCRAA